MIKFTADVVLSISLRGESSTGGGSNYKVSSSGISVVKLVLFESVKKVTVKGKD